MRSVRRVALVVAITPVLAVGAWIAMPLPDKFFAPPDGNGVTILDRAGLTLRSTRAADGSRATWVRYDEIDPDLINAFVAVEDRRFWEHHGVDVRALARATAQNLRARRVVSGASTITMQLARLVRRSSHTPAGKLGQALWALRIDAHVDKQEILEQYLNRVHLGQATVGAGAASQLYFATTASAVSLGQAATLAGLAHAPSRDNPHASPRRASARRVVALSRMRRSGFVTDRDVERAVAEPLVASHGRAPFLAPHLTTRVLAWIADSFEGRHPEPGAREAGDEGSAVLRTSLDLELQTLVESEVRHVVDVMRDRNVRHAAAVVLDNESGEVLAWVGSPDFWSSADGQTDMVVSPRQPGSALKPFLYALALDRGYTAASVLPDIPKAFATTTGSYQPRNYDRRFRGPVRAREALASSYNVPAVDLASRLGTGSLLHTLRLAGFESLRRSAEHYGLGLALGNGDVSLIELANAYRALANGGEWRSWSWRATSAAVRGEKRRVVSSQASAIVLDVLRDPVARIPGFGVLTPFEFGFPVAVKTGTSRHFTDNWAVGTTRRFTVAVWAGNFDGQPMQGVSGVAGAGPLLHSVVVATAKLYPPGELTTPAEAGAVPVRICRLSGMLATNACAQLTDWFVPGTEPSARDTWERGGRVVLPAEYAEWSAKENRVAGFGSQAAVTNDPQPATSDQSRFHIVSPRDGDRYAIPTGPEALYATISLRAIGADTVRWSVNGRPYTKDRWYLTPGTHEIEAVSDRGERARARIVVER